MEINIELIAKVPRRERCYCSTCFRKIALYCATLVISVVMEQSGTSGCGWNHILLLPYCSRNALNEISKILSLSPTAIDNPHKLRKLLE